MTELLHDPDGCPKCGHDLIYPPCPFSGWLKCANEDCGVCFDEFGIIVDEEFQEKIGVTNEENKQKGTKQRKKSE